MTSLLSPMDRQLYGRSRRVDDRGEREESAATYAYGLGGPQFAGLGVQAQCCVREAVDCGLAALLLGTHR